ncbi:FHA domain-containing protein [Glaciibacter psychrotolerans]|uniref:FHA domain-containing protein n=1 Tax=Glaciibacter psychrotolerans TaxID=670054 RepID=A0A7Z0J7H2_9MICO|nr:FHA domain-containing protein [Leifsonia psychrotolerans]NYJ20963.1 hypothetical protein [Leifsonia psychrotolerans]
MFCSACGQLVVQAPAFKAPAVPPPFGGITQPAKQSTGLPHRTAPAPAPVPLPPISAAPIAQPARAVPPAVPAPAAPATPTAHAAPGTPSAPIAHAVRFTSGQIVELSGGIILGRKPTGVSVPTGFTGVVVPDDTRQVSRAHVIVDARVSPPTVTDLGSANGTSIERSGLVQALNEGTAASLEPGDRLWLGSVSIDVL